VVCEQDENGQKIVIDFNQALIALAEKRGGINSGVKVE
jgi:hypothetical protein